MKRREYDDVDEDARMDAIDERRSRIHCKCGYPDWPGQCPGWRQCPVHGEAIREQTP